jgi:CcmD family protein
MKKRILSFLAAMSVAMATIVVGAPIVAAQQPTPQQQNEFVPVDDLPQADQLPAAPLVVTAYSVAWLATLLYLWSIWRRLQKVDRELDEVSRRLTERIRS